MSTFQTLMNVQAIRVKMVVCVLMMTTVIIALVKTIIRGTIAKVSALTKQSIIYRCRFLSIMHV